MARYRGNPLRNTRPLREDKPRLAAAERRRMVVRGAQYSPTVDRWIGFLFDGRYVTTFDPRISRARALKDAHAHYDRVFNPETPRKVWTPAA